MHIIFHLKLDSFCHCSTIVIFSVYSNLSNNSAHAELRTQNGTLVVVDDKSAFSYHIILSSTIYLRSVEELHNAPILYDMVQRRWHKHGYKIPMVLFLVIEMVLTALQVYNGVIFICSLCDTTHRQNTQNDL